MSSLLRYIVMTTLILVFIAGLIFAVSKTKQNKIISPNDRSTNDQQISVPPTRIAIISDIDRCVSREFATKENLMRFVHFANIQKVDLAISLGDNIAHRLGNCSDTAKGDLNFVMQSFSSLSVPMHYVLGDHDISDDPKTYALWQEATARDKTYYSFDHGDIHIIILDTVTGGNSPLECSDDKTCSQLITEKETLEQELTTNGFSHSEGKLVELSTTEPASIHPDNKKAFKKGRGNEIVSRITTIQNIQKIHNTNAQYIRDDTVRDNGLLGKEQLLWLSHDLATTNKQKILLLADHPLLSYTTNKKSYQINDLEALTQIILDAKSQDAKKDFAVIFGETHTWHKAIENDITYYGIDQFRSKDGTWALFTWGDTFTLQKVRDDEIYQEVE